MTVAALQNKKNVMPQASFTPMRSNLLQRRCACGGTPGPTGECAECRNKSLGLQREVPNRTSTPPVPPVVREVLRSSGQPLDTNARAFMEPRFGHDFSRVRIHTGEKAAESAQAVNALAYTVGQDVVFGTSQYAPATDAGRRLLAHELTHVVQQGNSAGGQASAVSRPSDPHEREAADVSERLTRTPASTPEPPRLAADGSASSAVQRQAAFPPDLGRGGEHGGSHLRHPILHTQELRARGQSDELADGSRRLGLGGLGCHHRGGRWQSHEERSQVVSA